MSLCTDVPGQSAPRPQRKGYCGQSTSDEGCRLVNLLASGYDVFDPMEYVTEKPKIEVLQSRYKRSKAMKSRFEIEQVCEAFLKRVFDDSKPARELMAKLMTGEIEDDEFNREIVKFSGNAKQYTDYAKEMADLVESLAKEAN